MRALALGAIDAPVKSLSNPPSNSRPIVSAVVARNSLPKSGIVLHLDFSDVVDFRRDIGSSLVGPWPYITALRIADADL